MTTTGGGVPQTVAAMLKQRRLWVEMTQVQLAEALGCDQGTVARAESGNYDPALSTVVRMLGGMGYTVALTVARGRRRWRVPLG